MSEEVVFYYVPMSLVIGILIGRSSVRKKIKFYKKQWRKWENEYWMLRKFPENQHRKLSWLKRGDPK